MANQKNKWTATKQTEVAEALGVSLASVAAWARQGMPGVPGKYPIPKIVQWLRNEGPWRPKAKSDDDGDPLLAEGDSPALERYRNAKAELAEIDVAERKKILVSIDKLKPVFLRWATTIRRCGEWLGKRWGNEAAEALNDALAECQRVVDDELGNADLADGVGEGGTDLDAGQREGPDRPADGSMDGG